MGYFRPKGCIFLMKRRIAWLLVLAIVLSLLLPGAAMGQKKRRAYIIPDSDTRLMTWDELWQWDYESVGYIFNEIFARHGYNFIPGEKYDNYFRTRPWYTPNENPDNSVACYPQLNSVEWKNEQLCKQVRAEMRRLGTTNPEGMNYLDYVESGNMDVLSGFRITALKSGQKLEVYSAPSESAWRGANGKAKVSTNGSVYAAGWVDGWLLIMYEINNGAVRVGYIHNIKGNVDAPALALSHTPMTLTASCTLTDDPATRSSSIRSFAAGDSVIYLSGFQNMNGSWAYVETTAEGKTVRGFIPMDALEALPDADEEAGKY